MLKIILITISILFILVAIFVISKIFYDRQDALKDTPIFSDTETETNVERPLPTNETVTPDNDTENEENFDQEQKPIKTTITREDCTAECDGFLADELTYCNEVCGLTIPPDSTDGDCTNVEDILEDYCWKNKAIDKTDFSYCEKIADGNVYTTCKNRVTEDIVDNIQSQN